MIKVFDTNHMGHPSAPLLGIFFHKNDAAFHTCCCMFYHLFHTLSIYLTTGHVTNTCSKTSSIFIKATTIKCFYWSSWGVPTWDSVWFKVQSLPCTVINSTVKYNFMICLNNICELTRKSHYTNMIKSYLSHKKKIRISFQTHSLIILS